MGRDVQIRAPLEHPCYTGHFPGNPIVPGVVLLELVVEALDLGSPRVIGGVKFHRAVRPGDAFTLRHELAGSKLTFRCVAGDELLVDGTMTLAVGGVSA
jgi:3-hydroxyacyl-[acyl-carrier-protein] dehydratase